MRNIKLIILLFTVGVANDLFPQKAKFVGQNEGVVIRVISRKTDDGMNGGFNTSPAFGLSFGSIQGSAMFTGRADTIFVGIDSGYFKANTEEILLLLEKEGYKTQTQLVTLSQVRAAKKRLVVNKLVRLPIRKTDDAYIVVKQVDLKLKRKDFVQKYYDSYEDYTAQRIERTVASENDITLENTVLEDYLNLFLIKTQHIDTNQKLYLNIFDRIKLNITVNAVTEHKFSQYCAVELRSTVKFESFFGDKKEVIKEYKTLSDVGFNYSYEKQGNNKLLMANALEQLFIAMLQDPELKRNFKNPEKELKKQNDSLTEILIVNTSTASPNLENATSAVVTVVEKGGHGSGCIISNTGYIITNYHVVSSETEDVYVIFNSGAKKKCTFIRGNPVYDLSLLKVDTLIETPLKINLSKTISVGSDVYAIGTPRDISLGQSITKGIISAKRTIDNKIFIQSDVSVNGGNSGGAMTNKDGELIGIVNAKLVGYGVEGVSFAIPAYYIEEFLRLKIVK